MSTPMLFSDAASPAPVGGAARRRAGARSAATPMLRLCVLGSGSGGNSSVLRFGDRAVLLDAGFGPVATTKRLVQAGLSLKMIEGICLTHLDQDHFRPTWARTLLGWSIHVWCHRWHVRALERIDGGQDLIDAGLVHTFDRDVFALLDDSVRFHPIGLAHDQKGTFGFRVETMDGAAMGYATDLGHVPEGLIEHFASVDLLAVESNYDPPMQLRSNRPLFLKRRIMGGLGHLSNQEAFAMVRRIDAAGAPGLPRHIVLLHRSRQCNSPEAIGQVFADDRDIWRRVTLTEQRRRSRWFTLRPRAKMDRGQLPLGFE